VTATEKPQYPSVVTQDCSPAPRNSFQHAFAERSLTLMLANWSAVEALAAALVACVLTIIDQAR
jgi:hypothetical protein